MHAPRISAFRRLLTGVGQRIKQRPHAEPEGAMPIARDPEMEQALLRLRDCLSLARELVPPAEWNANLEWILGSKRDPMVHAAGFDKKTVDAVVLWLGDLTASVNRTPGDPLKDPLEAARPDHFVRQSIARGLRDATEGYVLALGRLAPAVG